VQPASDLSWPEFDIGDVDFEQAISGNQLTNATANNEMLMPWSGGTGSWLDHLLDVTPDINFQQGMNLDPTFYSNPEPPHGFTNGAGAYFRGPV